MANFNNQFNQFMGGQASPTTFKTQLNSFMGSQTYATPKISQPTQISQPVQVSQPQQGFIQKAKNVIKSLYPTTAMGISTKKITTAIKGLTLKLVSPSTQQKIQQVSTQAKTIIKQQYSKENIISQVAPTKYLTGAFEQFIYNPKTKQLFPSIIIRDIYEISKLPVGSEERKKQEIELATTTAFFMSNAPRDISQGLTTAEARQILKVGKNATQEEIKQSTLNLLKKKFPEGLKSLASRYKVNEANLIWRAATTLYKGVVTPLGIFLEAGEKTPQELINKVMSSGQETTAEGKVALKIALQARATGQNIEITKVEPKTTPPPKLVGESRGEVIPKWKGVENMTSEEIRVFDKATIPEYFYRGIRKGMPDIGPKGSYRVTTDYKQALDYAGEGGRIIKTPFKFSEKLGWTRDENGLRQFGYGTLPKGTKFEPVAQPQATKGVGGVVEGGIKTEVKIPSKIARSIQQKAIEQKIIERNETLGDLAGYEKINVKEQAKMAYDLMGDMERARRIIKGEEALPEGLRGTALVTAMEEEMKKTGDAKLAYELANSPLVSETSLSAQELRLAAEREPDSLTLRLREIKQAREQALERRTSKSPSKAVRDEVGKIKEQIKTPSKYDWGEFLKLIQC